MSRMIKSSQTYIIVTNFICRYCLTRFKGTFLGPAIFVRYRFHYYSENSCTQNSFLDHELQFYFFAIIVIFITKFHRICNEFKLKWMLQTELCWNCCIDLAYESNNNKNNNNNLWSQVFMFIKLYLRNKKYHHVININEYFPSITYHLIFLINIACYDEICDLNYNLLICRLSIGKRMKKT